MLFWVNFVMTNEEERLQHWLTVLAEPDAHMSKIAAEKLGSLRLPQAVPSLIYAMQHRTASVAAAAALALGEIRDKNAIRPLIVTMMNHQDVVVQTAAAEALGAMKAVDAVPSLKRIVQDYLAKYENDRFNLTRGMSRGLFTTAIQSLREIGTREALRIAADAERAG
jgi:HEAT repeat protein